MDDSDQFVSVRRLFSYALPASCSSPGMMVEGSRTTRDLPLLLPPPSPIPLESLLFADEEDEADVFHADRPDPPWSLKHSTTPGRTLMSRGRRR